MSTFPLSRTNPAVAPVLSTAVGSTTAGGTVFVKLLAQNLAGNSLGGDTASISYAVGQGVVVEIPAAFSLPGEYLERYVVAISPTGAAGTFIQAACVEAIDGFDDYVSLPISVALSSDLQLGFNREIATPLVLPATALLGQLVTITSLGGRVFRFENSWPLPANGTSIISGSGGVWVEHNVNSLNPIPSSLTGPNGQAQSNLGIQSPPKLISYLGTGNYSRRFYYSISSDSAIDLLSGTRIGLQVLADSSNVTSRFSGKIEVTLYGYARADGTIDDSMAVSAPNILFDYNAGAQITLPVDLPAGSQAIYAVKIRFTQDDFAPLQGTRSLLINLYVQSESATKADFSSLTGSYIGSGGDRLVVTPGIGLSTITGSGQLVLNGFQSPLKSRQTTTGYSANSPFEQAVADVNGQVRSQLPTYNDGPNDALLATISTSPLEDVFSAGAITLGAPGGIVVTIDHPCDSSGNGTIRNSYPDRCAGKNYGRFNPTLIRVYLSSGGTTYRANYLPLAQPTQSASVTSLPSVTLASNAPSLSGFYEPGNISVAQSAGSIPAGTYTIAVAYSYDGSTPSGISHNGTVPFPSTGGLASLLSAAPSFNSITLDPSGVPNPQGGAISLYNNAGQLYQVINGVSSIVGAGGSGAVFASPPLSGNGLAGSPLTIDVNAITLGPDTITSSQLAANSVGTSELADNSVTSAKIQDGAITASDVAANTFAPFTHTHIATDIGDFSEAVDDRVAGLLVGGSNVTLSYNDTAGTLTINAATVAGGSGVTVSEADGSPSLTASSIIFDNGTVINQGGGVARVTAAGQIMPAFAVGTYIPLGVATMATPTTISITTGVDRFFPIWIDAPRTIDEIRVEVTTVLAGGTARLSIYDSSQNLVFGSATFSVATLGAVTISVSPSIALSRGFYYLGIASSGNCSIRALPVTSFPSLLGTNPAMGAALLYTTLLVTRAYAAFPATRPSAGEVLSAGVIPIALGRIA